MRIFVAFLFILVLSLSIIGYQKLQQVNETQQQIENELHNLHQTLQLVIQKQNHIIQKQRQIETKISNVNKHIDEAVEKALQNKIKRFIHDVNPTLSEDELDLITKTFVRVSQQYDVPLEILLSVAYQESHFKPYVENRYNCVGLMQINANVWCNKLGIPKSFIKHPVHNIEIGAAILRYYYNLTGSWDEAIIRYYGISSYAKRTYLPSVKRKLQLVKEVL